MLAMIGGDLEMKALNMASSFKFWSVEPEFHVILIQARGDWINRSELNKYVVWIASLSV